VFPQPAAESLNPLVSLGVEHLICCPSTNRPKFSLPKVQVESQRLVLGSRSQTKILPAAPAAIIPLAFTLSSQHIPVLRQMSSGFETGSFASRLGVCQGPPHTRRNPVRHCRPQTLAPHSAAAHVVRPHTARRSILSAAPPRPRGRARTHCRGARGADLTDIEDGKRCGLGREGFWYRRSARMIEIANSAHVFAGNKVAACWTNPKLEADRLWCR